MGLYPVWSCWRGWGVVLVVYENLNDDKPPLIDLCNLNPGHFHNSADRGHVMCLTANPTPWIAGNVPIDKVPNCIGRGTVQAATCVRRMDGLCDLPLRALCNGKTSAFQAEDTGSIPVARSIPAVTNNRRRRLADCSFSELRFTMMRDFLTVKMVQCLRTS